MTALSYITAGIMFLIAALHFLWGVGVYWPAENETSLARAVVGARDIAFMPSFLACAFVAACLGIGIVIVLRLGGVMEIGFLPLWLFKLAGAGLAFVFLSRGIVGFLPFWAEMTPEEPFRTFDKRYYSPLCLALGLAVRRLIFALR